MKNQNLPVDNQNDLFMHFVAISSYGQVATVAMHKFPSCESLSLIEKL
jgi:hypothetical protein